MALGIAVPLWALIILALYVLWRKGMIGRGTGPR